MTLAADPFDSPGALASAGPSGLATAPFRAVAVPGLGYLSVALVSGAVIALQIAVMRVFAVGSWAHFGSLVVSLAMMGFGLTSVVMCAASRWFEARAERAGAAALLAMGPLMVGSTLAAQRLPFNAIFLVSDPAQLQRLAANFALYLLPFLAGALFLGCVFLRARERFGRVYGADLAGAGLGGLAVLASLWVLPPETIILAPLALWALGALAWFARMGLRAGAAGLLATLILAGLSAGAHLALPGLTGTPQLAVSDYKGVAYARKFPDSRQVLRTLSPFGDLQVYASSYLHFAPGLSDNAAFNLASMPADAYLGLYIDGEGPFGVLRALGDADSAYFRFLPMDYPYGLKANPDTFVVQFGGGISTMVALRHSAHVTVAEANPAVLDAFRRSAALRAFTGDVLHRVTVVPEEGRLALAHTDHRYDVIDLSLADSAGLSSPGGFAVVEKYAYTREAMAAYMRALAPGGILSVTLWNKEEPPKSVLKLYATMAAAAHDVAAEDGGPGIADRFFVTSSYLSTATVLYKRGGFTPAEVASLRERTRAMSWDEITSPGYAFDASVTAPTLAAYREGIWGAAPAQAAKPAALTAADPTGPADASSLAGQPDPTAPPDAGGQDPTGPDPTGPDAASPDAAPAVLPATSMGRLAWNALLHGGWDELARAYPFDTSPLTNARPYFAGYVRPADLPRVTDRLDLLQDEWGTLLLWATLGIAGAAALVLAAVPAALRWRTLVRGQPGQARVILYFAGLGLGYIMVEVALIALFVRPLGNATLSASVLISGLLVFSGIGSLLAERWLDHARRTMPAVFLAIAGLLAAYALALGPLLDWCGTLPYGLRLLACLGLVAPPGVLMGFPMSTAMTWLGRLGKQPLFLWAWGINGSFSVIGAALVPVLAVSFGLPAALLTGAGAYLVALACFPALFAGPPRRAVLPA